MQLNPINYNWLNVNSLQITQTGFTAQEVQQILPDLVSTGDTTTITKPDGSTQTITDPLGINYTGFIPYIIKGIQEQQDQITSLSAKVSSLEVGGSGTLESDGSPVPVPKIEAEEGWFDRLTIVVEATFEKLVAKTAEIASAIIKKLTVESLAVEGDSVGQVTIPTGETELSVDYTDLTETSKVFFTLDRAVAAGVEKTPGEGFKLILADPADLPVTIDYWIVE